MDFFSRPGSIKTVHLIAVCGTGMASLACLLKEQGFHVTGSDTNIYPPMSEILAKAGIEVKPGWNRENIAPDTDLVIIGNAISRDNAEAQEAMKRRLPYASFPSALARFFLEGRKSLVVAGTHGKTTTSSLLSWVLVECGLEPGFMIGGWLKNFDANYRCPKGEYFVVEGDEYDTAYFDKRPKFLHYQPYAAILTGIEFDHADIFPSLAHIQTAFRHFAELIRSDGFLLVEHSQKDNHEVLGSAACEVQTYGFAEHADWFVSQYQCTRDGAEFNLKFQGNDIGSFRIPMRGQHNVENASAVIAMALKLGADKNRIASALELFQGIKRRQEVRGVKNGITVIDDFAHHPTAIEKTIRSVKEGFPDGRVWAVFEPRSATSRRNTFQKEFPGSFAPADKTIVAGLYAPEKIRPEERFDPEKAVSEIQATGAEAWYIPDLESILDRLQKNCVSGDVVLIMSSGGFDGIHEKLLDRL
jgi:UDP-N-acetylmuramate: L-alanyl-gamma-D-glutamyl-meso-diaminopimelate ligase